MVIQKRERNLLRTNNYSNICCLLPCVWAGLCGHVESMCDPFHQPHPLLQHRSISADTGCGLSTTLTPGKGVARSRQTWTRQSTQFLQNTVFHQFWWITVQPVASYNCCQCEQGAFGHGWSCVFGLHFNKSQRTLEVSINIPKGEEALGLWVSSIVK